MTTRRGAAKGSGSGYRNLRGFPRDSSIHKQSARGMKQPQRVNSVKLPLNKGFLGYFRKENTDELTKSIQEGLTKNKTPSVRDSGNDFDVSYENGNLVVSSIYELNAQQINFITKGGGFELQAVGGMEAVMVYYFKKERK